MIGWIFKNVPDARRGPAYAHDAWTFDPNSSPDCNVGNRTAAQYALDRLDITSRDEDPMKGPPAFRCAHRDWR